jgi:hypothetical protein
MEERSWFWRKIGWLFVPVRAQTWRLAEWSKVRRFYRWENSLHVRRALVVGWIFLLTFFAWVTLIPARISPGLGLTNAILWLGLSWWGFRTMRIRLAQPTLEDRAVMEYGSEFDDLTERQRGDLFHQQIRDGFMGSVRHDEREAALRMRSEGAAYSSAASRVGGCSCNLLVGLPAGTFCGRTRDVGDDRNRVYVACSGGTGASDTCTDVDAAG